MMFHTVSLFLWCASLCSGQITHWLKTTGDDSYASYKTENTSSWWAAANTICTRSGGQLFVPRKQSSLGDLTNLVDENKVYWVGGFQYSSLIWTEDSSRYYARVGYMSPSEAADVTPATLDSNSAFTCHLTCGNSEGLFGLKGSYCYCLGLRSKHLKLDIVRETRATEIRCQGDYNELCGDDTMMTVYIKDMMSVDISRSGRCGYVEKYRRTLNSKSYLSSNMADCEKTERFYACKNTTGVRFSNCSGNVCVTKEIGTWEKASSICTLIKVTDANKKNLRTVMNFATYWIGLRRVTEWRWIDGIQVESNFSHEDISRQCLAARREAGKLSLNWYNCSENFPAVCQSPALTSPETDLETAPVYVTGVGVTVGVVTVMVVCGIFVCITLKRKKIYCFKIKTQYTRNTGHCPGSESETTDGQDRNPSDKVPCLNDGNYCVIDDLESSRLYHHTTAAPGKDGEYDTTRQVQRARLDGSSYNHIRTEHIQDAADLGEGQYNLLKRGGSKGQICTTGLYHHVGPGVAVDDEDQYDALKRGRSPGQISDCAGAYYHIRPGIDAARNGRSPGHTDILQFVG